MKDTESGVGNFGKVGVGYFTSDSATLIQTTGPHKGDEFKFY